MKVQDLFEDDMPVAPQQAELVQEKKNLYGFLRAVTDWWNDQFPDERVSYQGPGMRVWTRGDGTRSRDPARIYAYHEDERGPATINHLWNALSKMKGAKPAGTVSGEFGSSPMKEAIAFRGFILVKQQFSIHVMSRSRITNPRSVWRHKPPQE